MTCTFLPIMTREGLMMAWFTRLERRKSCIIVRVMGWPLRVYEKSYPVTIARMSVPFARGA